MVEGTVIAVCQFGGDFVSNDDGTMSYSGGEAHALDISRDMKFDDLKSELASMFNIDSSHLSIKYFLPGNQRTLITISSDKDLRRMVDFNMGSITTDLYVSVDSRAHRNIAADSGTSIVDKVGAVCNVKSQRLTAVNGGSKRVPRGRISVVGANTHKVATGSIVENIRQLEVTTAGKSNGRIVAADSATLSASSPTVDIVGQQTLVTDDNIEDRCGNWRLTPNILRLVVSDSAPVKHQLSSTNRCCRGGGGKMGSSAMLSRRLLETDTPVMVHIQELIRKAKDPISLAQGVVYWQPPAQALDKVKEIVWDPSISRYGADEGLPELRQALTEKLRQENNLHKSSVMVTAGANQIAYPTEVEGFGAQLLKVQDNIPICASIIGQRLALYSLEVGPEWIEERVQKLVKNRELLVKALAPLGKDAVMGGEGAIYLWAKLPDKFSDDYEVVRWLVNRHGVVVIPGSASGGPGYIRISFGGLKEADCEVAAERLRRGLEELLTDGMVQ
ncbi:hypothetical protein COCNU_03G016340 [Cocos nucifera]|uniref:PB1 domain-containing protein n=1 Tax=Cocos nucifera TaxID=13894 RepID=A0A8K0MZH1_COCNU|nr:hypothetical protein COCNU_03G016340 [Cocos nucifera]